MFKKSQGFTLVEVLIVSGIIVIMAVVIGAFQRDLFSLNDFLQQSLSIQRDSQAVLRSVVAELRTASQSGTGGYPLEKVEANSLAFYSNIDQDASIERVQYFLNGKNFMKSVVKPTGNPLTYGTTTAPETLMLMLSDLVSTSTPIFSYYDGTYAGTTSPLTQPVDILKVRFVTVALTVDQDPNRAPGPITASSQVTIRNLKDNL